MVTVLHYLALMGSVVAAMLLVPALLAYGVGEYEQGLKLLIYSALGIFLSFSVLMSVRGRTENLNRVSSIYLVVTGWMMFPLIIAIPVSDLFAISYFDGVFESVSAFTTTAADAVANIDGVALSAIWLRSQIQWLGGLATLATFVLFLGPIRTGGLPPSISGVGEQFATGASVVNRVLWMVTRTYLVLTIACFAALMLCGVAPFASFILAGSAVSTGGYLPGSAPLINTAGSMGMIVIAVFLIAGATSIFWHRMIMRLQWQNLKNHLESYVLIAIALAFSAVFLFVLSTTSGVKTISDIRSLASESILNGASLVSTSGMQSRPGVFALLSPILVMSVALIGAGCYSTGGGIKLFRLGTMLSHSAGELSHLIYPHEVNKSTYGSKIKAALILKSIWTMFFAAALVIALSATVLALTGLSFGAALTTSVAAISNAGPIYSTDWVARGTPGWLAYSEMNYTQKTILAVVMLLGRLEIIAVIAAINPVYWLRR